MADRVERRGAAYEAGEELTVIGRKLERDETAPAFTLESFDAGAGAMRRVSLVDSAGQVRLLNVVNSLDTPVCHVETHRWESLRPTLPERVVVYTISMDLPYAQARWQAAEGTTQTMLSAHKSEQFGGDYGVLIDEWRLLQRAVFVIDGAGKIVYAEYVPDQMAEPDYDAAVRAAAQAAAQDS